MNNKAPWQRTFRAFAGPGIDRPSDMMRVSEREAAGRLAELAALAWREPIPAGSGRHAVYALRNAADSWCTTLFQGDSMVGFYAGSYLWIAPAHRGLGLSTPLILAAADHRGGGTLPPGVVFQGYTAGGVAAHRSAHRHAVLTALAEGLPVPPPVLAEIRAQDPGFKPLRPVDETLAAARTDDNPAG